MATIRSTTRPVLCLLLAGGLLLCAPAARASCEPATDQIVRVGTSSWLVERDLLAWYAKRPARIDDVVRVRRERGADGKVIGYRLMGIRCGSEPHLAGLRNGDILRSVNGRPVRSLPEAVLTYARVHGDRVIELEVLRRTGKVEVLVYTLS